MGQEVRGLHLRNQCYSSDNDIAANKELRSLLLNNHYITTLARYTSANILVLQAVCILHRLARTIDKLEPSISKQYAGAIRADIARLEPDFPVGTDEHRIKYLSDTLGWYMLEWYVLRSFVFGKVTGTPVTAWGLESLYLRRDDTLF